MTVLGNVYRPGDVSAPGGGGGGGDPNNLECSFIGGNSDHFNWANGGFGNGGGSGIYGKENSIVNPHFC